MLERIESLEDDVGYLLGDEGVDWETRQSVIDDLEEWRGVAAKLGRDDPFKRFLQDYLREERRRARGETDISGGVRELLPDDKSGDGGQGSAPAIADGGPREIPLCDCRDLLCPAKQGKVPARNIDDWLEEHTGNGAVYIEARALFAHLVEAYKGALREKRHELVEAAGPGSTPAGEL